FQEAKPGDYVVFYHDKEITLLRVGERSEKELVIEEITANEKAVSKEQNWQEWILEGAPNHTSWLISSFDIHNGKSLSTYSVAINEWTEPDQILSFLPTLLKLPMKEAPLDARKRIGPTPLSD